MSNEQIQAGARSHVAAWLDHNRARLGLEQIELESRESPAQTLAGWFETPAYRVEIGVWEHAYCLDILVLKKAGEELVFSAAGPCGTVSGLSERLDRFAEWMHAQPDQPSGAGYLMGRSR